MRKRRPRANALKIMDARYGQDPGWKKGAQEEHRKLAIGYLIRECREASGITQKELARRAGTSQSAISRIEDARYEGLRIETLLKIAEALDLPLAITLGKRSARLQPV